MTFLLTGHKKYSQMKTKPPQNGESNKHIPVYVKIMNKAPPIPLCPLETNIFKKNIRENPHNL